MKNSGTELREILKSRLEWKKKKDSECFLN